ncbi:MAG: DegV family protein [Firmicutes bacterium]|nr:DegV family protein [Bacillota bacterium]
MSINIIADSGCDLNNEIRKKLNLSIVPLTIELNNSEFLDDSNLNMKKFLNFMKKSPTAPKTASPSPIKFINNFSKSDTNLVVTLSSKISSTYNNAILAKDSDNSSVHVFDSLSASVGETLVCLKINELYNKNMTTPNIVKKVNDYINEMETFFLLDSLDNLIKSGRVNKIKGKLASILSIRPIMGATEEGTIKLIEKARGKKKSFKRLIDLIGEKGDNLEEKILGIAHCNCLDKAKKLKEEAIRNYNFKDVIIVKMGGVISSYANENGILIAF